MQMVSSSTQLTVPVIYDWWQVCKDWNIPKIGPPHGPAKAIFLVFKVSLNGCDRGPLTIN